MAKKVKSTGPEPLASVPLTQRPVPIGSLIGQERATAVLGDCLKSQRVHHAWVFYGPPGVGKFTMALALAALVLDPTTQATFSGDLEADPDSPVQRLLAAGTHPDLVVITKELARFHDDPDIRKRKQTAIPVDVIRQFLLGPGGLAPSIRTGSQIGRVFIVDEAELLGASAQNAVLKFLEEPPPRVLTILVTSNQDRLLPTIRSRSQRLFFPPLSDEAMNAWLKGRNLDLPADKRAWLLDFSEGSPGALILALDTGLFDWWQRLEPMLATVMRGGYTVQFGPAMAELAEAWAKAWVEDHENASKEGANKAAADWMFRLLGGHIRRGLPVARDPEPLLTAIDAIRQAESEVDSNVSMLFVFEKLSSELSQAFAGVAAR